MGQPGKLDPPLLLSEYDVLVDMNDPNLGFMLQPKQPNHRVWHLRALSEEDRLLWTRKMLH